MLPSYRSWQAGRSKCAEAAPRRAAVCRRPCLVGDYRIDLEPAPVSAREDAHPCSIGQWVGGDAVADLPYRSMSGSRKALMTEPLLRA